MQFQEYCGKLCKNHRGLKLHQTRMKCLERDSEVRRAGPEPEEPQEEPGQEATHRAQSLNIPRAPSSSRAVQEQELEPNKALISLAPLATEF